MGVAEVVQRLRFLRFLFAALLAVQLAACGESLPLKVGFIAGTSGRVADLGISGRNGAQLAVEQVNEKGGINGRKVELLIRDDEQDPDVARRRFRELVEARPVAVIGPMTSAMCAAVWPQVNENKLLTVSPTCTANEFAGRDDHLIRVIASARVYATLSAQYQHSVSGMRRAAVIYDARNRSYSESWAGDFKLAFEQLGGKVVSYLAFESGDNAGLVTMVEQALRAAPDGLVLVANSVDAALLTQHVRKRMPTLRLVAAEWAATERYIELAGMAAEGVVMPQFFDRGSSNSRYRAFRDRYRERFGEEPGFGSVTAYDAANVLFEAIARYPEAAPKDAVMSIRRFPGLQNVIEFDPAGDAMRDTFFTIVRDGKFVVVPRQ